MPVLLHQVLYRHKLKRHTGPLILLISSAAGQLGEGAGLAQPSSQPRKSGATAGSPVCKTLLASRTDLPKLLWWKRKCKYWKKLKLLLNAML